MQLHAKLGSVRVQRHMLAPVQPWQRLALSSCCFFLCLLFSTLFHICMPTCATQLQYRPNCSVNFISRIHQLGILNDLLPQIKTKIKNKSYRNCSNFSPVLWKCWVRFPVCLLRFLTDFLCPFRYSRYNVVMLLPSLSFKGHNRPIVQLVGTVGWSLSAISVNCKVRVFLSPNFYPEDGGSRFLRNIGNSSLPRQSEVRRKHPELFPW